MCDGNLAMNSHFENMSEKDMQEGFEWYEAELKKDVAIGFAEWCGKEGYSYLTHDDWRDDDYKMFTTEQLYQLFLTSKNR